jgi:threonine dehydrogenase-like Zn-dependent dehydrogenase
MHAPGDVRVEERSDPKIVAPTDAIVRLSGTCICGSDLWPTAERVGMFEPDVHLDRPLVRRVCNG